MKKIVIIFMSILVLLPVSGCRINWINQNKESRELCEKLSDFLSNDDAEGIKKLFRNDISSAPYFDDQLSDAMEFFDGKVISYKYGNCGSESSTEKGKQKYLFIWPNFTVTTDKNKTYKIYTNCTLVDVENPQTVGTSTIRIDCLNYKREFVLGDGFADNDEEAMKALQDAEDTINEIFSFFKEDDEDGFTEMIMNRHDVLRALIREGDQKGEQIKNDINKAFNFIDGKIISSGKTFKSCYGKQNDKEYSGWINDIITENGTEYSISFEGGTDHDADTLDEPMEYYLNILDIKITNETQAKSEIESSKDISDSVCMIDIDAQNAPWWAEWSPATSAET